MVTFEQATGEERLIIAQPNRSASWRANQILIALFSVWAGIVAAVFLNIGAWPVLPFLGLEIAGLAAGLYYVCWKVQQRHVLRLAVDGLVVEKGVYCPRRVWRFPHQGLSVSVEVQNHPWDPLKIFLCSPAEQIAFGEFLNRDDSKKLLSLLRQQGLAVRNYSELIRVDL